MLSHRNFTKIVKHIRKKYGKYIKLDRYPKEGWYGVYATNAVLEGSEEYYKLMETTGSISTKYFEDENGNIYPCHFSASIDINNDEEYAKKDFPDIPNISTRKIHKII